MRVPSVVAGGVGPAGATGPGRGVHGAVQSNGLREAACAAANEALWAAALAAYAAFSCAASRAATAAFQARSSSSATPRRASRAALVVGYGRPMWPAQVRP